MAKEIQAERPDGPILLWSAIQVHPASKQTLVDVGTTQQCSTNFHERKQPVVVSSSQMAGLHEYGLTERQYLHTGDTMIIFALGPVSEKIHTTELLPSCPSAQLAPSLEMKDTYLGSQAPLQSTQNTNLVCDMNYEVQLCHYELHLLYLGL